VRSSSETFAAWLRYALGAYLTEPTADEEGDYPTYSVVAEDGVGTPDRIGRRYNILYVGTSDVARTLDLRFLARCLLRQIDSIGYHERDDAVFLEAGVVEIAGSRSLIPKYLVPALCGARRRAEKRGIYAPGGMVAALDLRTGELIAPRGSLDLPSDALERLAAYVPAGVNGGRDHFPVEDGERTVAASVIGLAVGQEEAVAPKPRPETALDLAVNVKNMTVLGGRTLRAIAATVSAADCRGIRWSNTNEMIDTIAAAAEPERRTANAVRVRP
jgi:hypothetical protein